MSAKRTTSGSSRPVTIGHEDTLPPVRTTFRQMMQDARLGIHVQVAIQSQRVPAGD